MKRLYYHYTSIEGLERIIESRRFFPSHFSAHDSTYGEGWYLTDLTPTNADETLHRELWGQSLPHKTRCYISFEIDDRFLTKCKPHIFLLPIQSIPENILNIDTTYFESNTFYSYSNAPIVIQVNGVSYRKPIQLENKTDWKPIIQVAAGFALIIGVAALISAIVKSK